MERSKLSIRILITAQQMVAIRLSNTDQTSCRIKRYGTRIRLILTIKQLAQWIIGSPAAQCTTISPAGVTCGLQVSTRYPNNVASDVDKVRGRCHCWAVGHAYETVDLDWKATNPGHSRPGSYRDSASTPWGFAKAICYRGCCRASLHCFPAH